MADYLNQITQLNGSQISLMLLVFGITGVAGNHLAGKLLSKIIPRTTVIFIVSLLAIHIVIYFVGYNYASMVFIIALWGFIHSGGFLISNVNITSSTSQAPEFINSIFTSCGNLAVTIGSFTGGLVIAKYNVHNVVWATVGLLIIAIIAWFFKKRAVSSFH